MTKIILWFYLSCKRYLKRLPFVLILLLLPLGAAAASKTMNPENSGVSIAVFVEEAQDNSLGARLADRLTSRLPEDGMFRFYLCDSREQVADQVASGKAECGYVIYEKLQEKLDQKSMKRCIGLYSAPSTVLASLSSETVISVLMELYDRELLKTYVDQSSIFDSLGAPGAAGREPAVEKSGILYDKWLGNGSTFRFQYEFLGQTNQGTAETEAAPSIFPIRGIVAVFVFITGMYGAAVLCADEEKGLFCSLSYKLRTPCRMASLAGPVTLAAGFGLSALWLGGVSGPLFRETGAMVCYVGAITVISWLLHLIFRRAGTICCLIPFFIIGSLLFCPVFIDAGRMFPVIDKVAVLFPPYYYLRFFAP